MNWRELRKELFDSPPKTRTSNTFIHDDIFNSKQPSIHWEDNVGRSSYKTPKRVILREKRELKYIFQVRENDTTRSQVLDKSETKSERPLKQLGIKTFKAPKTI